MIADLHAQARAIAAGNDSLQDALLRAREHSLETACSHAYTRHPADVLAAAALSASSVGLKGQSGASAALAGRRTRASGAWRQSPRRHASAPRPRPQAAGAGARPRLASGGAGPEWGKVGGCGSGGCGSGVPA